MNNAARQRFHVAIAAIAALWTGVPLYGAAPAACGPLCTQWVLEEDSVGSVDAALDVALTKYKDPRPRRSRQPPPTLEGMVQADMDRALGTITDRPEREDLRKELRRLLAFPRHLAISLAGRDVLVAHPPDVPRRYSPGEPHARVDEWGTAEISCTLRDGRLTVNERYERSRQFTQTYAVQRGGRQLLLSYEVRRPGMEPLRVTATYRPEAPLSR